MARKDWDPLLSRKEAAELLGVKSGTLEVWASTGRYDLPYVKVGGLAKYRLSVLKNFVESRSSSSAARF
jgi:excisionase family DNA binding protein